MPIVPVRMRGLVAVVVAVCVSLVAPGLRAQQPGVEYAVKATYLYKFAPFVEWPIGTFASPTDPFLICVAGSDAVGDLVDEAVKGQTIGAHPIEIVHLAPGREARCHVLYVARHGAAASAEIARARGKPVLTVTDDAPEGHAIIDFVVQDNKVRFEIDQDAAAENDLVISSKLLNLAVRVRPRL